MENRSCAAKVTNQLHPNQSLKNPWPQEPGLTAEDKKPCGQCGLNDSEVDLSLTLSQLWYGRKDHNSPKPTTGLTKKAEIINLYNPKIEVFESSYTSYNSRGVNLSWTRVSLARLKPYTELNFFSLIHSQ